MQKSKTTGPPGLSLSSPSTVMISSRRGRCAGRALRPACSRFVRRFRRERDLRFLFDFLRVDAGFKLQELDLFLAKLLALGAILLEPLEPEHFPQQAILLFEPVGLLRPLRERLNERQRFLRQALEIDAENRCQRHLLISCSAISNKHDT
jgi:hypothetical protein